MQCFAKFPVIPGSCLLWLCYRGYIFTQKLATNALKMPLLQQKADTSLTYFAKKS